MKLKNFEVESIVKIITDPGSFRNDVTVKIPASIRMALRLNEEKLGSVANAYAQERAAILNGHIDQGHAKVDGEQIKIEHAFITEINQELTSLAVNENDIDLTTVDKETMEAFLATVNLSIPEEDMLRLFIEVKEAENNG